MKRIHAAILAATMFAIGTPSLADVVVKDTAWSSLPHREVRFNDLNLDTPQGIDKLNVRISAAVRTVCGQPDARIPREVAMTHTCRDQSLQRAFADRDSILAARLAARDDPSRLAALDTSIAIAAR